MKGRKEEKVKEIKGKGHSAIWAEGKRVKSQSVRAKCCVSEIKQKEKRKIERVRENTQ